LEIFDDNADINKAWESTRGNIKNSATESLGYRELKQYKPWFDEECSKLSYQRTPDKLQLLQNPSQINEDNMNNARCETISGTKKGIY
jgi:hypothetical protein